MLVPAKKYHNLFISLAIISCWASLVLAIFSHDFSGNMFGASIMFLLTREVGIVLGATCLLLRVVGIISSNANLAYILAGTLNFCLGLTCVVIYCITSTDRQILHIFLLNLLAGTLILVDTFFLEALDL